MIHYVYVAVSAPGDGAAEFALVSHDRSGCEMLQSRSHRPSLDGRRLR